MKMIIEVQFKDKPSETDCRKFVEDIRGQVFEKWKQIQFDSTFVGTLPDMLDDTTIVDFKIERPVDEYGYKAVGSKDHNQDDVLVCWNEIKVLPMVMRPHKLGEYQIRKDVGDGEVYLQLDGSFNYDRPSSPHFHEDEVDRLVEELGSGSYACLYWN